MSDFKFNPMKITKNILKTREILYINSHFFIYKNSGVFEVLPEFELYKIIVDLLGTKYRERWGREIKHCITTECHVRSENINKDKNLINIKNGMFCLKEMKIFPHSPKYLSTIQLPVEYKKDSECKLWEKTLNEIFLGKEWKINMLQEYMGYCLTSDNFYQKALLNYGQGANGKSLIIKILEKILGRENISSVPISHLDKRHYLAELFGKLVNLSIESESNIEINDANFKAIVSGDLLTVDEKYGKPFSFYPFCKLIFAMNTLPYVSDKTSAFYRRVLILSYEKEFSQKEQNKKLYYELLEEIDGIFLWMLEGLKRLNKNGLFTEDKEMIELIKEYRMDNNPTLSFVEEEICYDKDNELLKKDVYNTYCKWCKDYGYKPVSDKKLTKTIRGHFTNGVVEQRNATSRLWKGINWFSNELKVKEYDKEVEWPE